MSLRTRIRAAWDGFKLIRSEREVIESYVRPMDVGREGRYVKQDYMQLTARYLGYTKVAVSRNATQVASVPLRVMRRRAAGKSWRTAWDTVPVKDERLQWLRTGAGKYARKQASISDDVEEVTDPLHPLVQLLERVNGQINAFDLLEQTQTFLGLIGNAYWAVIRQGGIPVAIWPLQAQYVEALPDRQNFIRGYRFGRGYDVEKVYDAEDVIHFRQFNPNDPFYGMGDLAAHVDDADLSQLFTQAAIAMLKNGVQPGMVAIVPGATDDQVKVLEASITRKFKGAANWFKTWIINGPRGEKVEFKTVDIGEGATKFLAMPADKMMEKIANCHDMPKALLTLDSAALATAKAAIPQWQTMAIRPRCRRIEDQINQRLIPMFTGTTTGELFVAFDDAVHEDENEKIDRIVKMAGNRPLIAQNEGRAMLNLPPTKGGDDLNPPEPEPLGFGGKKPEPKALRLSQWHEWGRKEKAA